MFCVFPLLLFKLYNILYKHLQKFKYLSIYGRNKWTRKQEPTAVWNLMSWKCWLRNEMKQICKVFVSLLRNNITFNKSTGKDSVKINLQPLPHPSIGWLLLVHYILLKTRTYIYKSIIVLYNLDGPLCQQEMLVS